jgi:hypothetical protein
MESEENQECERLRAVLVLDLQLFYLVIPA